MRAGGGNLGRLNPSHCTSQLLRGAQTLITLPRPAAGVPHPRRGSEEHAVSSASPG